MSAKKKIIPKKSDRAKDNGSRSLSSKKNRSLHDYQLMQESSPDKALRESERLLAQEVKDAKQLQQISNLIIEKDNFQALYEAILSSAMDLMNSDFASIQYMDPDKNELFLLAYKGFHPESAKRWKYVNANSTTSYGQALKTGKRVIVDDIENFPFKISENDYEAYRLSGIVAMQTTPLNSRSGKHVGMISTHWKHVHHPSDHELDLFDVLARQAADLIQQRQAEDALRNLNESLEHQVEERTRELKSNQHELSEKNKQLQHTIAQLESFNYIASHDLREPLRKIQTYVALMNEQEIQDEELKSYLNSINESSARMSDLIQSLLNYSRLSKATDAFQTTDLNKILADVKTDFELLIEEKQAIIRNEMLPSIQAIPFQIHQLFANLIGNSLKFSNDNPEITITSKIISGDEVKQNGKSKNQKFVELKFSDNGIGFDNQYSEKIFQLFQRLHPKSDYGGTGIGLSIVDKIVQQHHGFVKAEGKEGKGATFTVWLPAN